MKKRTVLKSISSLALTVVLLGGCTTQSQPAPTVTQAPAKTEAATASAKADATQAPQEEANIYGLTSKEAEPITLPIVKDKISLSYFAMPEPYVVSKMKGYADMTVYQVAEEKTNINIKWREESYTDPKPKMNLMFSTGETDDIIWDAYVHAMGGQAAGAAKKLMDENLIVPLNSYIEDYAPNLKKMLLENDQLLKEISTDDGRIFIFPEIRLSAETRSNSGFQIRKDWLDKYNLSQPTTIDEWYNVLKTFKENDPDCIPFVTLGRNKTSQSMTNFSVAFGIVDGFYVDNGVVKYGPYEPEYKDYITTLAKWYSEGLIDPEFSTQDAKAFDAKVLDNRGGAYYAALSGNLGKYINAKKGEEFDLMGLPMPKATDGVSYAAINSFSKMVPHGASIGAKNKNIIETVKWLDWHYSPEGNDLLNWGVEGQAYVVNNGQKQFTDLVLSNPDGLSLEEAAAKYAGGVIVQWPAIDDVEVFKQLKLLLPQQQQASKFWASADTSLILPPVYFDEATTNENSNISTEIETYANEMFSRFIMGVEPLENYDKFVKVLQDMKVEKLIANNQEAYDRMYK